MNSDFQLPRDWHWETIDAVKAAGRSVVSGPFGSNIGKRFFVEQGVPVIRGNNLSLGMERFHDKGFVFLTNEKASEFINCEAHPGDLIFTAAGTIGQVGIIPLNPKYPKYIISNKQLRARLDEALIVPLFAYYWFASPPMVEMIKSRNTGSTIPLINLSILKSLPIPVPPLSIQKSIVDVVATLDDRITLLRETNTTLEAIAQALFKSWFVDFDPVRAKHEGRDPEGMDADTAALFPDSFEESELGLVPKGWTISSIGKMVEGIYDGPHATPPEADEGPIFLGIKNLTGTGLDLTDVRHIHEDQWQQWTRRITPRSGDIVFSYEATLGFFALIPPETRCCLGRRLALIRPFADGGCGHFWLHQFISPPFQRLLEKHTIQGATVNRIALKQFPNYSVLAPTEAIRSTFDQTVAPLWARIHTNQAKAQTLATLRDTLLPRLISGQLRLPDAEAK